MPDQSTMYYNSGSCLGVIGAEVAHRDGEYTYLPGHAFGDKGPWICSADLYSTLEEAEIAPVARFYQNRQE